MLVKTDDFNYNLKAHKCFNIIEQDLVMQLTKIN